jgi:hypothetical protein
MNNEFWNEVVGLIRPVPTQELEYRVYYNELGEIYRCSMQQHEPGDYLVVPKDQYDLYHQYRVVRGQMVKIDWDVGHRVQLQKAKNGHATVVGHAGLLIEDEDYTDREYYARIN